MITIDFATIRFNDANEYGQPFSMKRFETTLDGSALKLDFTTTPVKTISNNNSIPHESGGRFLLKVLESLFCVLGNISRMEVAAII